MVFGETVTEKKWNFVNGKAFIRWRSEVLEGGAFFGFFRFKFRFLLMVRLVSGMEDGYLNESVISYLVDLERGIIPKYFY